MSQADGNSDMVLLYCGSVGGEGSEKVQWLLSAVLSRRKLSPSSRPDSTHFSSSPYAAGALQGAAPVLEPRGSESV